MIYFHFIFQVEVPVAGATLSHGTEEAIEYPEAALYMHVFGDRKTLEMAPIKPATRRLLIRSQQMKLIYNNRNNSKGLIVIWKMDRLY